MKRCISYSLFKCSHIFFSFSFKKNRNNFKVQQTSKDKGKGRQLMVTHQHLNSYELTKTASSQKKKIQFFFYYCYYIKLYYVQILAPVFEQKLQFNLHTTSSLGIGYQNHNCNPKCKIYFKNLIYSFSTILINNLDNYILICHICDSR